MDTRQLRALRGTAAASVATWTAAVSHTVAGGAPPSAALVLVVVLLAAPFAVALAGRSFGAVRLALTVLLTQLLLHVTFSLTAGLDPTAGSHVHGAVLSASGAIDVVAPDPLMTLGHLVAAVVTTVVLARGEWMLRAIAAGIVRLLRPALFALVPLETAPAIAPAPEPRHPVARTLSSDVSRRGPPSSVVAA